jgi:membrane-bound lytic murein transglycosylase A
MRQASPQSLFASLILLLPMAASCATPAKDFNAPLAPGVDALIKVENHADWPDLREGFWHRDELMPSLERSLGWTLREHAKQFFPQAGISHGKAVESLARFQELLRSSTNPEEFEQAIRREFDLYQSAGWNGQGGGVLFTAYYTPILEGSLEPSQGFAHALYALPEELEKDKHGTILGLRTAGGLSPVPDRRAIEASGMLASRNLELVWLSDPMDAFLAHVNGSAFIRLRDGSMARFGYAGTNGHEYTSLAKELVKDGELKPDHAGLSSIRDWAQKHPDRVQKYLNRNARYVFFAPITGNPRGSLNLEVTGGRSLATDKSLFPRGAVVFVDTHTSGAALTNGPRFSQFMMDQDTGGAIRTAGRADIYLGVGAQAEADSGRMKAEGQMYYLFLK